MPNKSTTALRFIRITGKVCLTEIPIPPVKAKTPPNINHFFIRDRSGSMHYEAARLSADLKKQFRQVLRPGDTISLGWFSGQREFDFTVKGFAIHGPGDFDQLDKYVDAETPTVGMTCFSEVLAEFKRAILSLSPNGRPSALTFLTDGYPTVSPLREELEAIVKITREVSPLIRSALVVGYGPLYNKGLLTQMAQALGGSVIHSASLSDFVPTYEAFAAKARDADPRVLMALPAPYDKSGGLAFTVDGSTVRTYEVLHDAGLGLSARVDSGAGVVWLIGSEPISALEVKMSDIRRGGRDERALYGAALALQQSLGTDLALEVLGKLGDKAIIDAAVNAFTADEYGAVEALLSAAIGNPDKRFASGQKIGYLPPPDAFCLLDLLQMLQGDASAQFLPRHPAFEYRRIGVPRKAASNYPVFEADESVKVPFNSIVMHDTHLNLSFNCKIPGTIPLPAAAPDGTERPVLPSGIKAIAWKCHIWRTYALVRDGFLNVKKLPVVLSFESLVKLSAVVGLVENSKETWGPDRTYTLDLTKIPIMNRAMASDYLSAETLGSAAIEEVCLEGVLKGFRDARKSKGDPAGPEAKFQLTPEQAAYLTALGIRGDGTFNPPSTDSAVSDYYVAKTFELKVAGATLPSVGDVRKRVAAGKAGSLGLGAASVARGIDLADGVDAAKLDFMISNSTKRLRRLRADIQKAKFAIILGKQWFTEFKSRDPMECVREIAGHSVSFVLGEEKVDL